MPSIHDRKPISRSMATTHLLRTLRRWRIFRLLLLSNSCAVPTGEAKRQISLFCKLNRCMQSQVPHGVPGRKNDCSPEVRIFCQLLIKHRQLGAVAVRLGGEIMDLSCPVADPGVGEPESSRALSRSNQQQPCAGVGPAYESLKRRMRLELGSHSLPSGAVSGCLGEMRVIPSAELGMSGGAAG